MVAKCFCDANGKRKRAAGLATTFSHTNSGAKFSVSLRSANFVAMKVEPLPATVYNDVPFNPNGKFARGAAPPGLFAGRAGHAAGAKLFFVDVRT